MAGDISAVRVGMSLGGFASGFPHSHWLVTEGQRLEALGYDNVMVGDRPLWDRPSLEPITTLGLLAGTTSTMRCIAIFVLPLRNPMILARELAYSDFLSDGRCVAAGALGGDYPEEFSAVGIDPTERVARFEECIAALRHMWRGDPAAFEGSSPRSRATGSTRSRPEVGSRSGSPTEPDPNNHSSASRSRLTAGWPRG